MLFTQHSIAETAHAAARDVPVVVLGEDASGPEYAAMADSKPLTDLVPNCETHLLLFTSGTTGQPKAVRLTHMNIMWFAWQQIPYFGLDQSSVLLLVAPTFNIAGISEFVMPTLLVGGTVVIQPSRGWRPEVLVGIVDDWCVTHTSIFPSQIKPILDADQTETIGFESLRFVATGGENCPPEFLKRFRERWPHIRLLQGYGQTETGLVTVNVDDDLDRHAASVGRVVVGTRCRIIGPDGREVPHGATGELFVGGPSVSPGYWKAPDLTDASFVDGWFATGDLGHFDEHGLIYLSGRRKDVIISKGQNIYPAEIEHVLARHEQIASVAVVGIPDDEWGEVVTATVVRTPGSELSEADVVAFVRDALASYKKPRHVVFTDELPRNAVGKLDKAMLAELVRNMWA
jgi:fatty-acyl-CoA synthase